jgi:YbbR domain-containing protein
MESKKTRLKTGGRKSGSLNKSTRAVKEIASEHTESAIKTLADIMQDVEQPSVVRISAARELLDRAHGRPSQGIEIDTSTVHKIDLSAIDAELEKAALERAKRQKELEDSGILSQFET